MRIVLVNALFPPDTHGGAENYVLRTAKTLQPRGHDVSVLTTHPFDGLGSLKPERTTYEGVETWRFYPLNLAHRSDGTGSNVIAKAMWHQIDTENPHAPRVVGSLLDRIDPDVVHTNNLTGISPGVGASIQQRDLRHVHTLHDYSLICPKSNLLREFTAPDDELQVCEDPPVPCRIHARQKRRRVGRPDVVTAPSRHVLDVHHEHGFFRGLPSERIQLGVESVADEPPEVPDDPALIYVGKQLRSKGIPTLLDAAAELPSVTVHVCGSGPDEDLTRRRSKRLDNVRYHGYVDADTLRQLRRQSTAGVVPSIWMENSPLTIYESFAAGLPVIGSDIGGIPELVEDGVRGYLFEPGTVHELVSAVRDVLDNGQRMRREVLRWANERSFDAHVDELLAVYRDNS